MNKRHYEHTLPNIRGSLSNTYVASIFLVFKVVDKLQFVLMACPACFSKF